MTGERNWFPLTGTITRRRSGLVATAKKKGPIDPLSGPKLALAGRVVTMDDTFSVITDAVVYIENGSILAVQDRAKPAPAGTRIA